MKLPEKYCERMKRLLGDEYEAYLKSLEEPAACGLRVNRRKAAPEEILQAVPFSLERIPWTDNGFYYEDAAAPARHPYYYAGLYYLQEPSAMTPASRLPVQPGDRVLDLCAAPGGKATELGGRLGGKGFLLANDISASRAKALLKNLEMAGIPNCCVTAERPERLAEACPEYFDKILVDAPCSGEGMFRRDAKMAARWEEAPPETYLEVQRHLAECAVRMLRPGGMMLYSTCTFSREENEEVILGLLADHPEMEAVPVAPFSGFAQGFGDLPEAVRIFPHRMHGEGHFLALLRKADAAGSGDGQTAEPKESPCTGGRRKNGDSGGGRGREKSLSKEQLPEAVRDFLKLTTLDFSGGRFLLEREQAYWLPEGVDRHPGLRYLRSGLLLGSIRKERFEPSQALAMALGREGFGGVLNLSAEDPLTVKYLKGETIPLSGNAGPSPWRLVCVDGWPLGWGKASGAALKNKYSPGWRWM